MTQRERQILQLIEENPMISQEELAQKMGISRSSAAVHISNLMKKGYIAGKGYVLRSGTYVAVVGGVNIDIGGRSAAPLIPKDSNPGTVTTSLGGVGRNIAHNMTLLGVDVRMLTAFGDDDYARLIESSCANLGIDISHARKVKGGRTSTYLFMGGPDGDMALAVNDMAICEEITPRYISQNLTLLNNAQVVIIDTNLPADTIAYIADHVTAPIFADPVSTVKADKLKPVLGKLNTLKPNRMEAEHLSGIEIHNRRDLKKAARALLDTGLHRVFISLGSEGVYAADQKEAILVPCCRAHIKNATGAGDAFMAALGWAYLEGTNLADASAFASAAAAIAVEGEETINPELSVEAMKQKLLESQQ